jgi:hypothetical protein
VQEVRRKIIACFLLLTSCFLFAAPLDNIPTNSWIYDAIDYLKTAGYIKSIPPTSKPWTRQEVVELLKESGINKTYANSQAGFYIAQLLSQFSDDLLMDLDIPKPNPVYRLNYGEGDILFDYFVRLDHNNIQNTFSPNGHWLFPDNQTGSLGAIFNLDQSSKISFYNLFDLTFRRKNSPDTTDIAGIHFPGTRVKSYSNHVTMDFKQAYITCPFYFLTLQVGRDYLYFGPGYRSSVLLSDIAPSMDQIQLRAEKKNYKALWFCAALSPYNYFHRFLSGQRLEVSIGNNLRLGGSMLVIYSYDSSQTRGFFGYLNPIIPIYAEVSNTGHDDNILFGFDFSFYLKSVKFYGQLMLDNYEFNSRPNRPPNAYGLTLGTYVPINQFTLRTEYSKITRYTYYHRIYHIAYTQYSVPLGHALGPDADEIFCRFEYYPINTLCVSLVGTMTRRGDGNRGDLDNKTWDADEQPIREFPSGTIETSTLIGPEIYFQPRHDVRILGGIYCNNDKEIESFVRLEYRY